MTSDILRKDVEQAQRELKALDDELSSVMRHAPELKGSPALLDEERRSLRLRFPDIAMSQNATTDEVVAAVRQRYNDQLRKVARTAGALAMESKKRACDSQKEVEGHVASFERSDGFAKLSLNERLEFKRRVAAALSEGGDMCAPEEESSTEMNGTMNDVTPVDPL